MDSELKQISDNERVEETASRWFAKRRSGTWTETDQARLGAWLNECTAHRIAFIRLEAAWKHAARMKALGAGIPAGIVPPRGSWGDKLFSKVASHPPKVQQAPALQAVEPRRGIGWLTAAAAALLVIIAARYVYTSVTLPGHRYSTQIGVIETVPLSDGSHVILNTNSRIRVELARAERRVDLDQGEAFFEVVRSR